MPPIIPITYSGMAIASAILLVSCLFSEMLLSPWAMRQGANEYLARLISATTATLLTLCGWVLLL